MAVTRSSSASACTRPLMAQFSGTHPRRQGSGGQPLAPKGKPTLPSLTDARSPSATPQKRRSSNLFEKVCARELLYSDSPDLAKLRLYFKGLDLTMEQINLTHPETKWTFLHHFAYQGDSDLLAWGLQNGANHTASNAMGKTPLHLAAETNKPAAVLLLLKNGADPHAKTLAGFTPLHLAVLNRNVNVVRTLLGSSPMELDVYSESVHGTPLDLAKDPEIRHMLKEYSLNGWETGSKVPKKICRQLSLTRESSACSSAVPTPKSKKILLQPLMSRECSGQSASLELSINSANLQQLRAIERQSMYLKTLNVC